MKQKNETKKIVISLMVAILVSVFCLSNDVKAADNPYIAWISVFDPTYYISHNPQAAAYANGDIDRLWQYFTQVGIPKGEQASEEFNVFIYAKNYPELLNKFGGNMIQYYVHYAQTGKAAGLNGKTLNTSASNINTTNTQNTNLSVQDVSKYIEMRTIIRSNVSSLIEIEIKNHSNYDLVYNKFMVISRPSGVYTWCGMNYWIDETSRRGTIPGGYMSTIPLYYDNRDPVAVSTLSEGYITIWLDGQSFRIFLDGTGINSIEKLNIPL